MQFKSLTVDHLENRQLHGNAGTTQEACRNLIVTLWNEMNELNESQIMKFQFDGSSYFWNTHKIKDPNCGEIQTLYKFAKRFTPFEIKLKIDRYKSPHLWIIGLIPTFDGISRRTHRITSML